METVLRSLRQTRILTGGADDAPVHQDILQGFSARVLQGLHALARRQKRHQEVQPDENTESVCCRSAPEK